MFSHCFTGVFTIHSDLLPQPHSVTPTSLLHCLWASLGYIFQLSVRFFVIWQAYKLAISVFLHQLQGHLSPLHPGYLKGSFGYRTYLIALLWDLLAFGECWDLLVSLSSCLPSQPIPPAVLTHLCCPQLHSVFPPPPMMSNNLLQVSQMLWNTCRHHSEYPPPIPLARSYH